jgi:hypothetical protein
LAPVSLLALVVPPDDPPLGSLPLLVALPPEDVEVEVPPVLPDPLSLVVICEPVANVLSSRGSRAHPTQNAALASTTGPQCTVIIFMSKFPTAA